MNNLCPECQVNQKLLKEMLEEGYIWAKSQLGYHLVKSQNRTTAEHILSGCQSCKKVLYD